MSQIKQTENSPLDNSSPSSTLNISILTLNNVRENNVNIGLNIQYYIPDGNVLNCTADRPSGPLFMAGEDFQMYRKEVQFDPPTSTETDELLQYCYGWLKHKSFSFGRNEVVSLYYCKDLP